MNRTQKRELGDLMRSVVMATIFAAPGCFIPGFFPGVAPIPKILIWGMPFGAGIYAVRSTATKVRFRSFALTMAFQAITIALTIAFLFFFGFTALRALEIHRGFFSKPVMEFDAFLVGRPEVQIAVVFCFIAVIVTSGIYQISRKMGPGVLRGWMMGRYHQPREEERIFMFLDMKDSTTLAEKLGAIRFSALVRDFFADLTSPVIETKAEISHYIGDEAVLTWRVKNGLEDANCLRIFDFFQERLEKRRAHYERAYGLVPEFKAGAHIGPVVATEVGELKSEIVYHGDVLNTAARIQSMCNALGSPFLVSGDLQARLGKEMTSLGRHLLKGKEHDIEIFAVIPPTVQGGEAVTPQINEASPV